MARIRLSRAMPDHRWTTKAAATTSNVP